LGDLVANDNLGKFNQDEWKFLRMLSKFVDDGIDVIWVEGNHDIGIIEHLGNLLGVKVLDKFEWVWDGKRCIAIHGHQYDNMIGGRFSKFISWIYLELLNWTWFKKHFGEELSILARKWQRIVPDVARGCFELAKKGGNKLVFAGHTHLHQVIEDGGIIYINTGCWVETNSTMIVMKDSGLNIMEYANE
jgi:UDP-2,3-diacylglucosamine pyrophosphatase LpxH